MKKALCFILIFCLLFTFAGCNHSSNDTTTTDPTQPTIAEDIVIVQRPMISVSVPTATDITTAEDGAAIFQYVYPSMNLIFPDAGVAERVVEHHRARMIEQLPAVESTRQMALNDYRPGQTFLPYLYSVSYTPMRADQSVLSIFGSTSIYTGGAHPDHLGFGANYDMVTGEVLTLGSILTNIDQKTKLRDLVIVALDDIAQERHLSGYKNYVNQRFERDESTDQDWFFTNTGIAFFFDPYEIAPYSEGTIVAEVPYSSLVGIISDAYFPAERTPYYGTVQEIAFDNADLTKFTQTSELVIQSSGEKTVYFTETAVHDFTVRQVNPETGYVSTIFYAPYLTPGDAVVIEVPQALKGSLTIYYTASNTVNTIEY